jgi:hypothetical protein
MKRIGVASAATVCLLAAPAWASISLNSLSPVTENFDSMPSSGTTALNATVGTHNPIPGLTTWEGTKTSGTGTTLSFVADDGTNNSGRLASLGTTGSGERALGELASGSTITAFGVEIINNTGGTLTGVNLAGFREQWRSSTSSSGTPNTLTFGYAVSGGSATSTNYLTDATLTGFASLDLVGEAPVASNGATDGNTLRAAVSGSLPVSIPNGGSLFIRWTDVNDQGNDAALGLDDLTITPVPEPASLALLVLGGVAALRRRR